MAKRKRTNNDLQSTTQKTKDRVTLTPLKPGVNSSALTGTPYKLYSAKVGVKYQSFILRVL
jgi:hypothetical protein